jgi:hypothetical protein
MFIAFTSELIIYELFMSGVLTGSNYKNKRECFCYIRLLLQIVRTINFFNYYALLFPPNLFYRTIRSVGIIENQVYPKKLGGMNKYCVQTQAGHLNQNMAHP